jgi:hypothetical protein
MNMTRSMALHDIRDALFDTCAMLGDLWERCASWDGRCFDFGDITDNDYDYDDEDLDDDAGFNVGEEQPFEDICTATLVGSQACSTPLQSRRAVAGQGAFWCFSFLSTWRCWRAPMAAAFLLLIRLPALAAALDPHPDSHCPSASLHHASLHSTNLTLLCLNGLRSVTLLKLPSLSLAHSLTSSAMTLSLPYPPSSCASPVGPAKHLQRKRRRRAPASGASSDCFACTKRNTKCDRRRPYCSQCLELGKECSGYKTQLTWGVGVASRGKLRGLSLPVAKSAPVPRSPPVAQPRASSSMSRSLKPTEEEVKIKLESIRTMPSNPFMTYDFVNMALASPTLSTPLVHTLRAILHPPSTSRFPTTIPRLCNT